MTPNIFSLLTPDLYNSIYSCKSYSNEYDYIRRQVSFASSGSVQSDFTHCLEFGAGTGNLTSLLIGHHAKYLAVEPSPGFCDFLASRFSSSSDHFSVLQSTLEDSFSAVKDFVNPEKPVLCIANFNVVNYIRQDLFMSSLFEIGKLLPPQSLFIFDSWSLENVKKKPLNMSSTENFCLYPSGEVQDDKMTSIRRLSDSEFNAHANSLRINFAFEGRSAGSSDIVNLGSEMHTIFPYDLSKLCSAIRKSGWNLQDITRYSLINALNNRSFGMDFCSERNWYISLKNLWG